MVNVFGQKLIQCLRQLDAEAVDQVVERDLNTFCENLLRLHTERRNVPIGFQKMIELRTVGHPK